MAVKKEIPNTKHPLYNRWQNMKLGMRLQKYGWSVEKALTERG